MTILSGAGGDVDAVAAHPERCAAAGPGHPTACSGAGDEVRVRARGGAVTSGCALHAAALLRSLPHAHVEPGSGSGAVLRTYRLAQSFHCPRSFEFLRTAPWR
ncbi:hypothetical protein CLV92_110152 [Kineococcus xinjiangensis]|uniref:Uncharacterized protein n=1 Tax=Kineococcus xinjiangensis TaxID=512762 RepID=A0A2S6IH25_9ACTN|nr:hypothetical protein [Kineococcus xinjiangensis]PPK93524.1 hypothetical protein CLV92_110152 [Kineococcus xinjiangensis]